MGVAPRACRPESGKERAGMRMVTEELLLWRTAPCRDSLAVKHCAVRCLSGSSARRRAVPLWL